MIKSPKKSQRLKNKRLLTELELKNHVDTEPSVFADFNILKLFLNQNVHEFRGLMLLELKYLYIRTPKRIFFILL